MEKAKDILFYIKELDKKIREDLDKRLSLHDLTSQQGRILFYVYHHNVDLSSEVHQIDIEQHFALSKSTVSGLVKRLIKNGFLKKIHKGRYPSIETTDKGKAVIEDVQSKREITINKFFKNIDKEKQKSIEENLKLLIKNMEEDHL